MGKGGGGLLSAVGGIAGGLLGATPIGLMLGGPMAGAALGAGLGGMLDGSADAERAADAAERSGNAKLALQMRMRAEAMKAAEASPEELAQMEKAIAVNEKDIGRRQKLIDAADPALIESGKQAMQLLKGEEAATLAPLKREREKGRDKLLTQLRQRLGPGAEESTMGMQALAEYDAQSSSVFAQEQDRSLGRLLGVTQHTAANYGMQNNIQNASALGTQYGNIQGRKYNAAIGSPISSIGGQHDAAAIKAQHRTNQTNAMGSLVTSTMGMPGVSEGITAGAGAMGNWMSGMFNSPGGTSTGSGTFGGTGIKQGGFYATN